tara:strand:- start:3230 stop:3421 length:192 start_codon:yes stop_codon:yes gene_type:complete
MNTPNWQHHSKKDAKRKLKPQALRSARERRRQLINRLQTAPKRRFSSMIGTSKGITYACLPRN